MNGTEALHNDPLDALRRHAENSQPGQDYHDEGEARAIKQAGIAVSAALLYVGDCIRALARRAP